MAQHAQLRVDGALEVYFCDPQSPWQRGTNENTNGLLRQYFPKGTDLARHSPEDLAAVAAALNSRPRKRSAGEPPPRSSTSTWQRQPEPTQQRLAHDTRGPGADGRTRGCRRYGPAPPGEPPRRQSRPVHPAQPLAPIKRYVALTENSV